MRYTNKLYAAKLFANNAHGSQVRKYTGEPYIVHPMAVAELVSTVPHDENMLAAALLHDVLEDTHTTYAEIETKFDRDVADLVLELTDEKSALPRFVRKLNARVRLGLSSPRAQTIKLADLIDNTKDIAKHDKDFATVYMEEKHMLLFYLTKGDPTLFEKAKKQVEAYKLSCN